MGELVIGSAETRYQGKATVMLHGTQKSASVMLSDLSLVEVANKVLLVTGGLKIFGK